MTVWGFAQLMRMIYGDRPVELARIQAMGLLAVKIGQAHALRADFLSAAKCQELARLYRANVPIPPEQALANVDCAPFSRIDTQPLASASVGQVYRAELKSGESVVIKAIKPHFRAQFEQDVRSLRRLLRVSTTLYPPLKRVFNPLGILDHIEEYTLQELDLLLEIEGQLRLQRVAEPWRDHPFLRPLQFPRLYREFSTSQVMVSEFVPGATFDELLEQHRLPYEALLDLFKVHGVFLFRIGVFHGDLHPGNLIWREGKIYFLDTGAVSTVSARVRQGLLALFRHLSAYDYTSAAAALQGMSQVTLGRAEYARYLEAFQSLYADFKGSTVAQVSLTRKMMETIRLGVVSGMRFEDDMFPIIKSLMYLDGMVLRCHPQARLLEDMRPAVEAFASAVS